jgi:hypothetical protein
MNRRNFLRGATVLPVVPFMLLLGKERKEPLPHFQTGMLIRPTPFNDMVDRINDLEQNY